MALTPQQTEELKAMVEQRRVALRREDGLDKVVGAVPDPGDASVQSVIQDLDQLRMLDAARARMAEGRYGVCIECGEDIGFERLRANPGAERCIQCQRQFEKTHASHTRTTL